MNHFLRGGVNITETGVSITEISIPDTIVSDTVQQIQDEQASYVVLGDDSLFQINLHLGPYSTEERAAVISGRIQKLVANEKKIVTDSFKISDINNFSVIVYKNNPLVYIGTADADYYKKTREQLALDYLQIVKISFGKMIEKDTLLNWLIDIGLTLLSILGLWFLFFLLNKLFKIINH